MLATTLFRSCDERLMFDGLKNRGREPLAITQRSLSVVRPLAQSALADSAIFDLRDLVVEQEHDALVLRGSVSSYYHKQMAQEVVRAVAGREVDVVNAIEVR